jgi:hypothetical protein
MRLWRPNSNKDGCWDREGTMSTLIKNFPQFLGIVIVSLKSMNINDVSIDGKVGKCLNLTFTITL